MLHSHDASRAAADTQRDASLLRSTLSGWRKTLKRNVKEEAMAGVAYDYILKRRAWSFWLQKRARQKQVAWEASRKQALVRQFFDGASCARLRVRMRSIKLTLTPRFGPQTGGRVRTEPESCSRSRSSRAKSLSRCASLPSYLPRLSRR